MYMYMYIYMYLQLYNVHVHVYTCMYNMYILHVHIHVLCCFALFVCLTLLASFFLPSHLLKHVYILHIFYRRKCL